MENLTIEKLVERQFATENEISDIIGIKQKINNGKNEFGFIDSVIIDNSNNKWGYSEEDQIYYLSNS